MRQVPFLGAPLCPAGHLPLKGGDRMASTLSPIFGVEKKAQALKLQISPLEGEMAGGPEGGAAPPACHGVASI
ncbi:lytic murein transglycosylase [Mesorhizobium sp. M7A.F.Ca.US.001.01.1.1]|nr:lytic murein transglycosylase [Mesorhizobium sp. M7A.F.Ca.US.001.01.1.1]